MKSLKLSKKLENIFNICKIIETLTVVYFLAFNYVFLGLNAESGLTTSFLLT